MNFKILLGFLFAGISLSAWSQSTVEIPFNRIIWHENIAKSQRKIDRLDGKEDHQVLVQNNEAVTKKASNALFVIVDSIRNGIEADSGLDNNNKIKYLRGLNELLSYFEISVRKERGAQPTHIPQVLEAFISAVQLERRGSSIASLVEALPLELGDVLLNSYAFSNNPGFAESKALLQSKSIALQPTDILPSLQRHPNVAFADSLIKIAAYATPEDLYSYAQSNTELSAMIQSHSDPLVKMISKLANMNTGRLYFPFLDNLYRGRMTMEEITTNMENKYKYFRMLVNTEIDYAGRFRQGDTPLVRSTLSGMIKRKAVEDFINVINALHDEPDAVRMKEVEPLNSQELYYLCVMGDPEIYTSSYLKVYDRMFQRMKNPSSDSLLSSVNYDFFKKFIKMAAGYNRLDHFLKNMHKGNAETLMTSFASNLEKTFTLEDAVDVADSYASIYNKELRKLIYDEIRTSYSRLLNSNNKRGVVIYDILSSIFESMDPVSTVNLSAKFGIPPVYTVNNKALRDSAGRIVIQQFFYGDKDGNLVFNNFRAVFSRANWKTVNKPEWIEVSSTKGVPITIYANRPLDATKELDAKAQANLGYYLREKGLQPTVVIHRGHSYFVNYTIKQIQPSAKVVLLGSCGGYHNIHEVLKRSPNAHIIASKQVGSGTINQPMIVNLTEDMRLGKDLNWPQKWRHFSNVFNNKDLFDDYIPPHRNLGAIFIMAYKKTFGNDRS